MKKLTVLAFGGNALLKSNQAGTIDEQEQNVYETCQQLVSLLKSGHDLVIGHGNGPQVGTVLLQHEAGNRIYGLPKQPIDFCVAETQGSIGFMIEQQLRNVLYENGINRNVVTILTQVIVDKNDQAFTSPNKPVGPFYTEAETEELKKGHTDWVFHKDPRGRGWRRVVASPRPVEIPNWPAVKQLAREGTIVITVGGGGIPAYYDDKGKMIGIDAVVDKDLASSMLARKINADEFCILTDIPNVYINFRQPNERKLEKVALDEIRKHLADGQFAEGSMAPKVRACIEFVEHSGKEAIITEVSQIGNPDSGTIIYR